MVTNGAQQRQYKVSLEQLKKGKRKIKEIAENVASSDKIMNFRNILYKTGCGNGRNHLMKSVTDRHYRVGWSRSCNYQS